MFVYCLDYCYPFFKEYIESWFDPLRDTLTVYEGEQHPFSLPDAPESGPHVFLQNMNQHQLTFPKEQAFSICLINTEQYTRLKNVDRRIYDLSKTAAKFPLSTFSICDYSAGNSILWSNHAADKAAELAQTLVCPVSRYLPYQNHPVEQAKLVQMLQGTPKTYDVAFVGTQSLRRWDIINQLRARGLVVEWIQDFEDARDQKIAAAKLLLNVHWSADFQMYESIRCDRWLFANHTVVSESSTFPEDWTEKVSTLHVCAFEKLTDTVCQVLRNWTEPDSLTNEIAIQRESDKRRAIFLSWKQSLSPKASIPDTVSVPLGSPPFISDRLPK